jgi:hypothetical protein
MVAAKVATLPHGGNRSKSPIGDLEPTPAPTQFALCFEEWRSRNYPTTAALRGKHKD